MIRINKGEKGPTILSSPSGKAKMATAILFSQFDNGQTEFEFDSGIYGAKAVKQRLIDAQFGKCCFCESQITHIDYGDVEHFRPKGGYVQDIGLAIEKPGYYWLAYEWSNLFLSCALCNQRHKANQFPLLNPESRSRSHRDDVNRERPPFIHPSLEDPEEFIGYNEHQPFGRDPQKRGETTIEALGLDRAELEERRRKQLDEAKRTFRTVDLLRRLRDRGGELDAEIRNLLTDSEVALHAYQSQSTEYSSMLRCAGIIN